MNIRMLRLTTLLLTAVCTPTALFADSKMDASPFGINGVGLMHSFRNPDWQYNQKRAETMKQAGITWDRGEMWWGVVEPEQGKFDWAYFDKMAEFYREQKINPMIILCYTSAWSEKPPTDDAERARYANYVYQVVNRYKDTIKVWEIWNEPNIPSFWKDPNARDYALMLKEAYKAAKKADPDCVILAASTSGPDLTFIKGMYDNGGWDFCDAISIHPYSLAGPPVEQRLDSTLRIIQTYIARTGKSKPLWITEMGWTAHNPREEKDQAIALFQSYVISMSNGVEKLFWFCLNDWDEKWGIVRNSDPFKPKLAYDAYKLMTERFMEAGNCAKFEGFLQTQEGTAAYVFQKADGERIIALWSNDSNFQTVELNQKSGLKAVDIFGKDVPVNNGKVTVGKTPVIVTGAKEIGRVSTAFNPYLERKGKNLLNNSSLNTVYGDYCACWNAGRFFGTDNKGKFAVSKDGRNNNNCVSISKSTAPAAWDAYATPIESGKTYKLTAWVRTEGASGNNQIAIFWYTGNMWTYLSEVRSENITGTTGWTKLTVTGKAPDDAMFIRANLISENNTGTVWFDDVELVEE